MQSLHPHDEGSPNEGRVIQFIEERLALLRLAPRKSDFSKAIGGHSFSRILEVTVKGRSPDTLILAIPLNHGREAGPDENGSFGIALGLRLLEDLRRQAPAVTVKVVFLGGEYESEIGTPLGSARFLNSFFAEQRLAVLYLNLKSFPAPLTLQYGGRGAAAPLWLVNAARQALDRSGLPHVIPVGKMPVFRSGLATSPGAIDAYLNAGLPAVGIETNGPPLTPAAVKESAAQFTRFITDFTASFPERIPAEWDRHFIFVSLPFLPPLALSETVYLLMLLISLSILFIVAAQNIPRLKKYAATLKRNLWNIPFFLAAAFVILLGATYLLELVLVFKNFPGLWTHVPELFFALKLGAFFFAAALLFRLARRLPFAKNGSFYSAAALLFTVLCVLVAAVINISFVHYFLWTLGGIVLFSLTRSRGLKIIAACLSPVPLFAVLYDVFSLRELKICEVILLNKFPGNLLFAVMVLPFVLLLIRIRLFFPYRRRAFFTSKSFLFMSGFFLAMAAVLVVLFVYHPFDARHPQPVLAEQIIDFDRKTNQLSLSSAAPLGEIQIIDKNGVHPVNTVSRQYLMPLSEVRDHLSFQSTSSRFAARKNLDLRLFCQGQPYRIRAVIAAERDFQLYDSNFPAERLAGNRYALSIGAHPPSPLPLELTLPMDVTYTLELEVFYLKPPLDVDIRGEGITLDRRLTFKKSLLLPL